jgi:hypothetical protein
MHLKLLSILHGGEGQGGDEGDGGDGPAGLVEVLEGETLAHVPKLKEEENK